MTKPSHRLAFVLGVPIAFAGLGAVRENARCEMVRGRVIDAESAEPLPGAVVVVATFRCSLMPSMEGCREIFSRVVEVVSDADGVFSVDTSPGWSLRSLHDQRALVLKPGYRPYGRYWTPRGPGAVLPDGDVSLVKARDRRELHTPVTSPGLDLTIGTSSYDVPARLVPRLIRLRRLQDKLLASIQRGGAALR